MKTIFITLFQGAEAKTILRTDIYRRLAAEPDLRLVFFVPSEAKRDYYRREFSSPRVVYEVFDRYQPSMFDRWFGQLKIYLLKTKTMDWKRRLRRFETGNSLRFAASWLANRMFARRWFRRVARWFDFRFVQNRDFADYFERYHPDLVFSIHLFGDAEIAMIREAKHRGVPTIGLVNSWDKLTSRAIIRILPDRLLVHNERIKREAAMHADMPGDRITVTGVPNYDYLIREPRSPREEFVKRAGLDPTGRLILYCPAGPSFTPDGDLAILDTLELFRRDGTIPVDVQILVRFQPNDRVPEELLRPRPGFVFERPGKRFSTERGVDWDMDFGDLAHLADSIHHAALVITHVSSIILESAILDRPIITADLERELGRPLLGSISWRFHTDHHEDILESGGAWKVDSRAELAKAIRAYLADPALHRDGRAEIVRHQCGAMDGRAGIRVASIMLGTPHW